MKANTNPTKTELLEEFTGKGFHVYQYKTGELAIFSYLVESHGSALLIDPTVDTEAYKETLAKTKANLKYVVLSHFHADYIAGHLEFKVPTLMGERAARPSLGFEVQEFKSGSSINIGEIKLTVLHTPGHTLESTCYLLTDRDGKEELLFTGDTLFLGDVGRPDLAVSSELKADDLAGMLFDSLQKLRVLKPNVKILPGHGSGSSCGKAIGDGNVCTLEKQMKSNYAFQMHNREEFMKKVLQDMPKPPAYFFHDAKINQDGPRPFQTQFKHNHTQLPLEQFKELAKKGLTVVDTRSSMEELKKGTNLTYVGYIKGALLIAEAGAFSTWMGNLIDPKKEFLLFTDADKSKEIAERLVRIGYSAAGENAFTMDEWKAKGGEITIPKFATVAELKNAPNKFILDVRAEGEAKEGHIEGSVNIPFGKLEENVRL